MARVTVNITARDLTGPQLRRMRGNFNNLGQDMDRVMTDRTRANFQRLSQSITTARRDLTNLRGTIPDDEFNRLDDAIRRAQNRMGQGFRRTNLQRVAADIRQVQQGFRDLDRTGQIRLRVDTAALRRADALLNQWRRDQQRDGVRIRVAPDVDTNRVRTRLRASLTSPFRTTGRLLGGTLSDGIGQGLASGFKGIGPIMAAVLVVAIGGALALVGAALAGILVTALGAAFVGIGGVSAAMSEKVKSHWSKALESMKKDFAGVGEPMIPVLDRAIDRLERMSGEIAPKLKKSIEETTPFTEQFINSLMDGFERFGQNAFKPIMDAWKVFGPMFGQEFEAFMGELGDSFKEMANLVKEHPEEIRLAIRAVFEAIDLLIDSITFLGKAWVFMAQNAGDVFGFILQGLRGILIGVDTVVEGILKAGSFLPKAMGGDVFKEMHASFTEYADSAAAKLEDMANAAYGWDDAINKANRKRKLEVDITSYQSALSKARADMSKTTSKKAKAKLEADIRDLEEKLRRARVGLDSINGKVATTYVHTQYTVGGTPHGGRPLEYAHGGIRGFSAAAAGGVRSNMTMVAEQGPEMIDLAPGSRVRSNPDTRRIMAQRDGQGGQLQQINLVVDGRVLARVVYDPLRNEIRDRGGNVQSALGVRGKQ